MSILFIVNDEVSRRSINPILEIFILNKCKFRILENHYSMNFMKIYRGDFIEESDAINFSWQFIISANPIKKGKFKGRYVSIPHGTMFGNNAWSLNRALNSDIFFGISPHELTYIKHHLRDRFDECKFIPSGNPANDYLIELFNSNSATKTSKKKLFGLDDRKTILLSSHWTSLGNLRKFGIGLLDAIIWNFPDYQVICTCHPKLLTSPKVEFRINKTVFTPHFNANWLISSLKARENNLIKVILNNTNPAELLFISDIFIGDNSSHLAEASFFEIPLIVNSKGSYFDKAIAKIVSSETHQFNNIEELIGNLSYIEDPNNSDIKVGRMIKKIFMFNVGSSARTIFDSLNSMR